MKTILASVSALLILTGCNSTNSNPPTNNSEKTVANSQTNGDSVIAANTTQASNGAICRQEKVFGSNMRRTVCRTRAQIEEEKREAELAQKDIRRQVGGDINAALKQSRGGR